MTLDERQIALLRSLALREDFSLLSGDECDETFEALVEELQMHGLAGDGSELSECGRLVDSVALELTRAPNY